MKYVFLVIGVSGLITTALSGNLPAFLWCVAWCVAAPAMFKD